MLEEVLGIKKTVSQLTAKSNTEEVNQESLQIETIDEPMN